MSKTGPKPRTLETAWEYLLSIAEKENDCLLVKKGRSIGIGYKTVGANGLSYYAHHVAYHHKTGALPKGLVVRHTCDHPNCIQPSHLIRGTHADNVADKVKKGRQSKGVHHYKSALTEQDVRTIRESPQNYAELSAKYGISRGGIHNIKSRRSWKHI